MKTTDWNRLYSFPTFCHSLIRLSFFLYIHARVWWQSAVNTDALTCKRFLSFSLSLSLSAFFILWVGLRASVLFCFLWRCVYIDDIQHNLLFASTCSRLQKRERKRKMRHFSFSSFSLIMFASCKEKEKKKKKVSRYSCRERRMSFCQNREKRAREKKMRDLSKYATYDTRDREREKFVQRWSLTWQESKKKWEKPFFSYTYDKWKIS